FLEWTTPTTLEAAASGAPWVLISISVITIIPAAGVAWGIWRGLIQNPFKRHDEEEVSPAILEPENIEESPVESIA
ncbi:MAG TPA: hypothetical protein QF646_01355, partial [Candidatus Poseidoniales archaeon]|nr:hypothetical protein [Candidatus Poseidoniales archaeon]